jgi:hypothetical protein
MPPEMTTPTETHDSVSTGQRFVAAIARRAWEELAACLDDAVQFRALTPKGLRSADDRASAASYVQKWFGEPDQFALLSSEVQPMHDRLHIRYRFRAHKDQWYLIEQQAYCFVQDGQIQRMDLVCSGFRPEVVPALEQK